MPSLVRRILGIKLATPPILKYAGGKGLNSPKSGRLYPLHSEGISDCFPRSEGVQKDPKLCANLSFFFAQNELR
jgi:hypothetical protein